jgi:hypothetical protein
MATSALPNHKSFVALRSKTSEYQRLQGEKEVAKVSS